MKTVVLIENADELVDIFFRARTVGDTRPVAPDGAHIRLRRQMGHPVILVDCEGFEIRDPISTADVVRVIAERGFTVPVLVEEDEP